MMYTEIMMRSTRELYQTENALYAPLSKYKIDFSFQHLVGRTVGIATLEISGKKIAAVEYGVCTSVIIKNLLIKLKLQVNNPTKYKAEQPVYCH